MTVYQVSEHVTLIISLFVIIIGELLCNYIHFLRKAAIPSPVLGGIIGSLVVTLIEFTLNVRIDFGEQIRDVLILLFFVSLGFTAKLAALRTGGKPLFFICLTTVVLLVLQNFIGIGVALIRGSHPFYGLLAGSISFVGGPGTAMAWAREASSLGLRGAELVAISAATFAVSVGAVVAGPIVSWIVKKHKLHNDNKESAGQISKSPETAPFAASTTNLVRSFLLIAITIWLGMQLNTYAAEKELLLPGFLCSLLAGMLMTNLADLRKIPMPLQITDRVGEIALQIFLAISLMSLKLSSLGKIIVPISLVVILQVLLSFLVAYYMLFRLLGKNYDAAVACGGFIGFAVSSMPVAMATMEQVTKRFGPAPKAILLITLAGSFFVDLANTFIVKAFIPFMPSITR